MLQGYLRADGRKGGRKIYDLVQCGGNGEPTKSEALGHQEFILTYKSFEPLGPACLPA